MIIYNEDKAESEAIVDLLLDILIDIFLETTTTKEEGDLNDK